MPGYSLVLAHVGSPLYSDQCLGVLDWCDHAACTQLDPGQHKFRAVARRCFTDKYTKDAFVPSHVIWVYWMYHSPRTPSLLHIIEARCHIISTFHSGKAAI